MDINVGVFCDDVERAYKFILDKIGGIENVLSYQKGKSDLIVITRVCRFRWVGPHHTARGYKFNFAYVQEDWGNDERCQMRVRPMLMANWDCMTDEVI